MTNPASDLAAELANRARAFDSNLPYLEARAKLEGLYERRRNAGLGEYEKLTEQITKLEEEAARLSRDEEPGEFKEGVATDPPVSEPQRKAMQAAAHGHSTLGIPKSVGEEFVGKAHDEAPRGRWGGRSAKRA